MKIGEAAKALGVSISTLRRWQKKGKLEPVLTPGGHRRYDMSKLLPQEFHAAETSACKTIAYARSSHDQKDDLERQQKDLELYCAKNGWTFERIVDRGSGQKALSHILEAILADRVDRLVITHKDRLPRFGAELVFALCEAKNVEIIIVNEEEDVCCEEDDAKDVLAMIDLFSARLRQAFQKESEDA